MDESTPLVRRLLDSVSSATTSSLLEGFRTISPQRNQLLMFLKPECFSSSTRSQRQATCEMVCSKLDEHRAVITGAATLTGALLAETKVMDRHYGIINRLSRAASVTMSQAELAAMCGKLNWSSEKPIQILGGHEVLQRYGSLSPESLNALWQTKPSLKLRSGFYVQIFDITGESTLVVNGFHPMQLAQYTADTSVIVILLLETESDWRLMRERMAGDTYPEKALRSSIRGQLYGDSVRYGVKDVSVGRNGIHLSAGPFEAAFEIHNFLGALTGRLEVQALAPFVMSVGSQMAAYDLTVHDVERALGNPVLEWHSRRMDLFGATENLNMLAAIELYKEAVGVEGGAK